MIALNGLLEPTTRHGVTTYLWKGSFEANTAKGDQPNEKGRRLGLQMVCQWEFVSTATGEIIYERGLDRDGRTTYGLSIHRPVWSSRDAPRALCRSGRLSATPTQFSPEYVQLHDDNDGREDRVTFRDGKNLPAAGPFGAFGQDMRYNSRGQITRLLSLDANGQPMLDDAGNCGLIATFNAKGWEIEERSVGPDLKQMPLKDGWVINRFQYDEIGRLRLITYYDAAGRPVLHKNGYHGWKPVYDDHGNQIAATFMGLDGKPTLLADGYSTWKASYDGHGRMIRMSYYGLGGNPSCIAMVTMPGRRSSTNMGTKLPCGFSAWTQSRPLSPAAIRWSSKPTTTAAELFKRASTEWPENPSFKKMVITAGEPI